MQTHLSRLHRAWPSCRAFRQSLRGWPGGRVPRALPGLLLTITLAAQAQAQPVPTGARPDPLDPKTSVPALRYSSSLAQHRNGGDAKPVSWKEANDAVARIGGWRVYAREAQQPDPAPAATSADAKTAATPTDAKPAAKAADAGPAPKSTDSAKPTPTGHGGHKMP